MPKGIKGSNPPCNIPECFSPSRCNGMCNMHYKRSRTGVPLDRPPRELTRHAPGTLCSVPECERLATSREWCSMHWKRWHKYGDPSFVDHPRHREPGCVIEGCAAPQVSRGWCVKHYQRWQAHGDPLHTDVLMDVSREERFAAKIDREGPVPLTRPELGCCHLWIGGRSSNGYGAFAWREGGKVHMVGAHRFAYELMVGPIPSGFVLDHLCKRHDCVRPSHLEAVTERENLRRGNSFAGVNARKDRCPQGHSYDSENTHISPSGGRTCNECSRIKARRHTAPKTADPSITRLAVLERDAWLCRLCQTPIPREAMLPNPLFGTIDHVHPVSLGGEHRWDNVQAAHLGCNCRKGNHVSEESL